jgi:Type II secretion system (T2SS), protein M subtype b
MKRLRDMLGVSGLVAVVLLLASVAFSSFFLAPLEERNRAVLSALSRKPATGLPGADKVEAVYDHLRTDADTTDWLAKLHTIGAATGVQLKSASYRTLKTDARIVRYEIVLPATGSYAQLRDFLKRALEDIPVLSVDSLSMKRVDDQIHAEMRLTLHMVKS